MKSFLQGKKPLAVESLRPPPQFASQSPGCAASHPSGGGQAPSGSTTHVEVVKEGDKVVRLIITCTCGERVEIDCLYSAGR